MITRDMELSKTSKIFNKLRIIIFDITELGHLLHQAILCFNNKKQLIQIFKNDKIHVLIFKSI